jgi:hypothetical protein
MQAISFLKPLRHSRLSWGIRFPPGCPTYLIPEIHATVITEA